MKRIVYSLLLILVIFLAYVEREKIIVIYDTYFVPLEEKVTKLEKNQYYRDYDFSYVKNTTNFIPSNKNDILNIYYTVVNSGMTDFTFYCPSEYSTCIEDVKDLAYNQDVISNLNNFVHPYNSFKKLKTEIETTGKISLNIEKIYDDEMIIILNYKVNDIIKNIIQNTDTERDKIKKIHDYIINNTTYDKNRSDKKIINYKSDNAYGVLIENYGLCGGYTDAMMLFLEVLNIPSIKISTENHIWNYVKVDDKWLHLDLTWDDPITQDNKNILDYSYFLISDTTLNSIEKIEHNYDKTIFNQN